jgi:hypothetical protein
MEGTNEEEIIKYIQINQPSKKYYATYSSKSKSKKSFSQIGLFPSKINLQLKNISQTL